MVNDRQTDKMTEAVITILRLPYRGEVIILCVNKCQVIPHLRHQQK